jgi:hypothetical protein
MTKKNKPGGGCSSSCGSSCGGAGGKFKIEGIVDVDSRGRIILPKGVSDKAGIKSRDKLVVATMFQEGSIPYILLIREDMFKR